MSLESPAFFPQAVRSTCFAPIQQKLPEQKRDSVTWDQFGHHLLLHPSNGTRVTAIAVQVVCRGRITRAGFPATTAPAATSLVTTLPAPTVAASPIVMPHMIVAPEPIDAPRLTIVGTHAQSASV